MPIEIERKFLVIGEPWLENTIEGIRYTQGYISTNPECTIRVRVSEDKGYFTIKGKASQAICAEYEYEIPQYEAQEMLKTMLKNSPIEKIRYKIPYGSHLWDVDVFLSNNNGLVLAEIELQHLDEEFVKPQWIGEEVTQDMRYKNAHLSLHPFNTW